MPLDLHPSSSDSGAILLVDDDPGVRDALGGQLEVEGYAVTTAADGPQALELLQQLHFPVIISDQQMPGMTGLELFARTRKLQPNASRILITGVMSVPTLVQAINEGEIHRFLSKPWNRVELVATVHNAIQRHDLLEANAQLQADTAQLNEELTAQLQVVRAQNEQLAEAQEALAENFQRSLGLCHRVVMTFSPLLGKRTRVVLDLCRKLVEVPGAPFSKNERHVLLTSAWLHDIGLLGVPHGTLRRFLNEPESCTGDDWLQIRQHPIFGQTLAAFVDPLISVGETIRAHHERWDGAGYPDGLAGRHIPWPARCLAVVAAYVGLNMSRDEALAVLRRQAGTAFDSEAVVLLSKIATTSHIPRAVNEVGVRDLIPGMQLARGIYSSSGLLLMAEGEELTPSSINRLRENGQLAGESTRLLVYR
jgi:response regulator RpfG family c-di-GMP phosphodiesterase